MLTTPFPVAGRPGGQGHRDRLPQHQAARGGAQMRREVRSRERGPIQAAREAAQLRHLGQEAADSGTSADDPGGPRDHHVISGARDEVHDRGTRTRLCLASSSTLC